jgi:ATP-dependent RNA helicase DeaD
MSIEETVSTGAFAALGVPSAIAAAIEARGYTTPTAVQAALLDPGLEGRDVLVSSQTGSGKTVAFGLLLAPSLTTGEARSGGTCTPMAIVIAPTRELANQVREELSWLLAPVGARVVAVTGGTSVGGELRALAAGAEVVVGTPGRLNDHLRRGAVDPVGVTTVVLDEADEMLDMGFREELESILDTLPVERRTVMLSATMPDGIAALARRYQRDAVRIAMDRPGSANADIAYVGHVVPPADKLNAVVNILLSNPEERTMVFVRTRAEAGEMAGALSDLGFAAAPLTGEMAQRERTQTLDAFRAGRVAVLVATDVAARGIDVPEVTRVIHADLPGDAAALTHRSGRTGRAGRKGTSILLVPTFARGRANELLRSAGVRPIWRPVPAADEIAAAADARLREKLLGDAPESAPSERHQALAAALMSEGDPQALVARLLCELRYDGPCAARTLRPVDTGKTFRPREGGFTPREGGYTPRENSFAPRERSFAPRGEREGGFAPRGEREGGFAPRAEREEGFAPRGRGDERFVMFRVNFGERHGATPARLLAMVCRRGAVQGREVGAISIGGNGSTFGVAPSVASSFANAASRPDERDPHVRIERMLGGAPSESRPQGGFAPRKRREWDSRERSS